MRSLYFDGSTGWLIFWFLAVPPIAIMWLFWSLRFR